MDKLKGELVDIIEWTDDSRDTIAWRFPRYNNEIKMGAKLTVRPGQAAVFVDEGQIADVFQPGMYELSTQNMPIMSTLKGWRYGFDSPFRSEVYFVTTRQLTDMKWGTQNPITMRDKEFGMVRLRAFGAYAAQVVDPAKLLNQLVSTDPMFRTEEIEEYLRSLISGRLGPALAKLQVPMLDMVASQDEVGNKLAGALTQELGEYGLAIRKFIIENISLPPEVEKMLDKRTSMGVLGDMNTYQQFQTANAVEQAAQNPGGAGEGVGLGMGMAMGQQMAGNMAQQQYRPQQAPQQQAPAGPPPMPAAEQWYLGVGGQQKGPFETSALAQQGLKPDTLVWKQGMASWQPASQVPELASVLQSGPPPLPGS